MRLNARERRWTLSSHRSRKPTGRDGPVRANERRAFFGALKHRHRRAASTKDHANVGGCDHDVGYVPLSLRRSSFVVTTGRRWTRLERIVVVVRHEWHSRYVLSTAVWMCCVSRARTKCFRRVGCADGDRKKNRCEKNNGQKNKTERRTNRSEDKQWAAAENSRQIRIHCVHTRAPALARSRLPRTRNGPSGGRYARQQSVAAMFNEHVTRRRPIAAAGVWSAGEPSEGRRRWGNRCR